MEDVFFFLTKMEVFFFFFLNFVARANELNLSSRTELFVNFKQAELELKK